MSEPADRRVIACNYAEGISPVSAGSLCYVLDANRGGGGDRVRLLARSRGGRWIEKWETRKRLTNFRMKTVPPEHPRYAQLEFAAPESDLPMLLGPIPK